MKNEINIPVQIVELKEADKISAAERRRKYSIARDIQAAEYNETIASRLAKEEENDNEKQENSHK